jgi:hypothetical protein
MGDSVNMGDEKLREEGRKCNKGFWNRSFTSEIVNRDSQWQRESLVVPPEFLPELQCGK